MISFEGNCAQNQNVQGYLPESIIASVYDALYVCLCSNYASVAQKPPTRLAGTASQTV